jgi:hypothetical protein
MLIISVGMSIFGAGTSKMLIVFAEAYAFDTAPRARDAGVP